jgi:hypothetical protein
MLMQQSTLLVIIRVRRMSVACMVGVRFVFVGIYSHHSSAARGDLVQEKYIEMKVKSRDRDAFLLFNGSLYTLKTSVIRDRASGRISAVIESHVREESWSISRPYAHGEEALNNEMTRPLSRHRCFLLTPYVASMFYWMARSSRGFPPP